MNEHVYPYITRKLQQAVENGSTPGAALLVARKGELFYRHAVGQAQIYPESRPLREDTLFDIASLTKVVATTTAIMLLLRDNALALADPIHKYLPAFANEQVTFIHLLTHSAGLPEHLALYEDVQKEADRQGPDFVGSPAAKQLVVVKVCQTALLAAPGEKYAYSDLGFILLGEAIEKIAGMPFDRFCAERIFAPLGMTATFFRKYGETLRPGEYAATERCEWRRRILCGEVHDENAYAMGGVAGHAGLFSTLDDMHQFMRMLYQCYQGDNDFVPPALVRRFFARQHLPETSTRAFGWDTPSARNSSGGELISQTAVGHTGFTGTCLWYDLPRELVMLLFANRIHPSRNNQRFLKMRPKIHDTVIITVDRLET